MPKYTITVPVSAQATVRHVEAPGPDEAMENASTPSLCAQCAGMGNPNEALDLGEPDWEEAEALLEGPDGKVTDEAHEASSRRFEQRMRDLAGQARQQARDQRDGRRWRQLLDGLGVDELRYLADDARAQGLPEDVLDAMTDRADDRERAAEAAAKPGT